MSIIERIEFQPVGLQETQRQISSINNELARTGPAGAAAGLGLQSVEEAAEGADSGLADLADGVRELGNGFRESTAWIESLTGSVARVVGGIGLAVLAFEGIKAVAGIVNDLLGDTTVKFETMTDEVVKARTGIEDISTAMDAYAKSLGRSNAALLTFAEAQAGMAAIANGGGSQTVEILGQRAKVKLDELNAIRTQIQDAEGIFGNAAALVPLRQREREAADELARISRAQAATQARRERDRLAGIFDGAGVNEGIERIGTGFGRSSAGGGAPAEVGMYDPDWLRAARDAARGVGGLAQRTADAERYGGIAGTLGGAARSFGEQTAGFFGGAIEGAAAQKQELDDLFDASRIQQFSDIAGGAADNLAQAFAASAASALLFGDSFEKGVNQALKALAAQAAGEALYQGAKSLAFLAMGNVPSATLAGEAAAAFALVATVAGLGAAGTGGLRGRSGAGGRGGSTPAEVGTDRTQETTFAPTIVVGLDSDVVYDRLTRITETREGSRSRRRFAMAA